jgi:hypothetical protein
MIAAQSPTRRAQLPRRLILALAFVLALVAAAAVERPAHFALASEALAQATAPTPATPPAPPRAPKPPQAATAPEAPVTPERPEPPVPPSAKGEASPTVGVTIRDKDRKVVVSGFGHKEEYDSFADFVDEAPWVAGLVFLTVTLVFMVPLLTIVLVIWYKMRKTRMMNETMLKLAERGIVPPGEAMDAIAGNRSAAATLQSGLGTAPLYEQAKAIQRRASWSDLRKGVIMSAAGFALQAWSILDDGTPNSVGLVLLFVGVGYIVLWYFEDRHSPRGNAGGNSGGGA